MDITGLAAGFYLIKITTESGIKIAKIVKN
ncbi:MAG: T9SS type A sorting domain-containing protein [Flavobacteriales bacterium]|nr:T9SS type A sorting domain-containing protein [Flavobacteriales bacterium]